MSTKPMQRESCSKCSCCQKHYVADARTHCDVFARYAFLLLFLFFTFPHTAYGITNTPTEVKSAKQNVGTKSTIPTATTPLVHGAPHFLPNRTVIVELFEWKFVDVSAECTNFLGTKGYAGVQLSPVTEHLLAGVQAQSWLARCQPVSFKFATRSGSVEDFLAMSRACNAAGVRVYVDVVLNHMAGDTSILEDTLLLGTAGSTVNVSALDYAGVPFDASDFHEPCSLENYSDAFEVRNCQLNGQPDLNQSKVTVHERIVEFLNILIELGVAGFRVDAAKYMWPNDLQNIYAAVNNLNSEEFDFEVNSRAIFYQEVVDMGVDAVSKTEYSVYGIVTEYLYSAELSTIFRGKVPLSSLINWGPAMGFLAHQDALVFVDTHESQHGYLERELGQNQLLSYKQQRRYVMATAFMLMHPYGRIKRILSSYHFAASDKQRGPPTLELAVEDKAEQPSMRMRIRSPEFDISEQCAAASGWVCEHRWPAIVNVLALVNDLSALEDGIRDFQTYGPNHIAFCRGQKAFIAINNDAVLDYATTVHTCLEPGVYCDIISGGRKADASDCHGKRIVVKEHGMADLMLPAVGTTVDIKNVDADNDGGDVDADDDNGDSVVEWNGTAVDVDYDVIVIYIGSKLVSSNVKENETGTALKQRHTMDTEGSTKVVADQMRGGLRDEFLFGSIEESQLERVPFEKEEFVAENSTEMSPDELMIETLNETTTTE